MPTHLPRWRALANAALALVLLGLAGFGATKVAQRHWRLRETFAARAEFAQVGGLEAGAKVRLQGIDAGIVEAVLPPNEPGGPVVLRLKIDKRLASLIRVDAMASLATQGVVGAKVVEIKPGRPDADLLANGGLLRSEPPVELADVLNDARAAVKKVDEAAGAARDGLAEITAIATTIRSGEGSLGKLVKDDNAYREFMALSDRGRKTLDGLDENLDAVKNTWPISRHFDRRGYTDREKALFHPGAERQSRTLNESDLFEPGRAVLTAGGRRRLDEIAAWFKATRRPLSEVVIAAFHDDPRGPDLAQQLSQEQAEAVRAYLVKTHGIDAKGWFGSRKVAAVGFGSTQPRTLGDSAGNMPPRRVEIILFTPQA